VSKGFGNVKDVLSVEEMCSVGCLAVLDCL
jgi:hypothetical protein